MAFTKISDLTVLEFVGVAYAEFGHDRFAIGVMTHYLSMLLCDSFKVGHVKVVERLTGMALENGLVRTSQSSSGGISFEVTELGVEEAAEVELPHDKFETRAGIQREKHRHAIANAAPVFDALLRVTPEKDVHGRAFIQNVLKHWLAHGWLSSKQVAALAQIGTRHGEFIEERHYVGVALDAWISAYIKRQRDAL